MTVTVPLLLPHVADIVTTPGVLFAVKVVVAVPLLLASVVTVLDSVPRVLSLKTKFTVMPFGSGRPPLSATVAVIVTVPVAETVDGFADKITLAAGGAMTVMLDAADCDISEQEAVTATDPVTPCGKRY